MKAIKGKNLLLIVPGIVFLFIPLLKDFHIESAMIAAVVGCFWAAIYLAGNTDSSDLKATIKICGNIYLIGIPPFIYSLFSGCLSLDGIAFWIFTPLPSIFFGASIGRVFRKFNFAKPKFASVLFLLFVAIGIWLYEFYNYPQVYFFNHVWGIWPGPIYDETVHISASYLYFRWITFLWIIILWLIPTYKLDRNRHFITVVALIALLYSYVNLTEIQIISPRQALQDHLTGTMESTNFKIYYDSTAYNRVELDYWIKKHEFYFEDVINVLDLNWPKEEKIESYLYAHAWQKKKLTGAKFTSYVPIWLETGQLHIAKQQLDDVLHHEMVHVLSRVFGNNLFNGSRSIGMIEGLAEAIAKDASPKSTMDQIVASEKPYPTTQQMESVFSLVGFYQHAGAISYSTTGSFIEFLLENYSPMKLKRAYAKGNIQEIYEKPFDQLIAEWHRHLNNTPVDSVDIQLSEFIYAQRSLFQKICPHSVSMEQELWDNYHFQLAEGDTIKAHMVLQDLFEMNSENDFVLAEWMRMKLKQNQANKAIQAVDTKDTLLTLQLLKADGIFLDSGYRSAQRALNKVVSKIASSKDLNFKYSLMIRKDSMHWRQLVKLRYKDNLPDSSTFVNLNVASKVMVLQKVLDLKNDEALKFYSMLMSQDPLNADFFNTYMNQLDRLIYLNAFDLAESLLKNLMQMDLRARYIQRLKQMEQWFFFISKQQM